jgi:putative flippase GtrA
MSVDWRRGFTSMAVAGGVALLVMIVLHKLFTSSINPVFALAIGIGIGVSRLFVWNFRK